MRNMHNYNVGLLGMAFHGQDAGIIRGIAAHAQRADWNIHLGGQNWHESKALLEQTNLDGFIAHVSDSQVSEALLATERPVVNISGMQPDNYPFPFICNDLKLAGQMAAEYFIQRGFNHFVCEPAPGRFTGDYINHAALSFIQTITGKGFKCNELEESTAFERDGTYQDPLPICTKASIADMPKPFALLAMTDRLGVRMCSILRSSGVRIPEEVSVMGIGNFDLICECCIPSISSIITADYDLGMAAAKLLDSLISGHKPKSKQQLIPPAGIATRLSTASVAIKDPLIAKSIHLIRNSDLRAINCQKVADGIGVNRRKLERLFDSVLHHSIHDEIQSWRIAKARLLLQTTDYPMKTVATESGFRNSDHMSKVFRRQTGLRPMQIRDYGRRSRLEANPPESTKTGSPPWAIPLPLSTE